MVDVYYPNTIDDLDDAKILLTKIQSEGFVNATIVEE